MCKWIIFSGKNQYLKGSNKNRDIQPVLGQPLLVRKVAKLREVVEQPLIIFSNAPKEVSTTLMNHPLLGEHYLLEDFEWDRVVDDAVIITESRISFTNRQLISDIAERADHLSKEHIIYRYQDKPVAIAMSSEHLKMIANEHPEVFESDEILKDIQISLSTLFNEHINFELKDEDVEVATSMKALQQVISFYQQEKIDLLLDDGVLVMDPSSTWIDTDVEVGADTIIYPNTILEGNTVIGKDCLIGPSVRIKNSVLGDKIVVKDSTIVSSKVGNETTIGPYAYLRPQSDIGVGVKIGDFVEVKNARVDDGAKVSHLSYVGDGHVGKRVNVGCGVVFVNYDGQNKNQTIIEDDAFIGCNVNLVAPVTIREGAYVAAGSTITDEVDSNSLAIARCRQTQKKDWVLNKRG
jgi:bifunctional N-acetylglucosamine-1-phosphate-uridyltransferase/glucosamine-1-phosphate-acetyltransferase GlmU-like protein